MACPAEKTVDFAGTPVEKTAAEGNLVGNTSASVGGTAGDNPSVHLVGETAGSWESAGHTPSASAAVAAFAVGAVALA